MQNRLRLKTALICVTMCGAFPLFSQDARLSLTPPMGWSSWNHFHESVDEKTIIEVADALVSSGMRDAGYVYVNLDDPWADSRDPAGNIVADPVRFPHGIKYLADYVHSRGLKFGIYTSVTNLTCLSKPGSLGYEALDAAAYAQWGVDAVKDDFCFGGSPDAIQAMVAAVKNTGRPMLFEADSGAVTSSWFWARGLVDMWRTGFDIQPGWDSVLRITDEMDDPQRAAYAGPGHWNDPDMLEVGNAPLSDAECRVHFGLWCMFAAPLMAGNDVRTMPDSIRSILTNPEVIAVDQDQLGMEGYRVRKSGSQNIWARRLVDGSMAVALVNRGDLPQAISLSWSDIRPDTPLQVRDLWARQDADAALLQHDGIAPMVPPHDIAMFKFTYATTDTLKVLSACALNNSTIRIRYSATVERASAEDVSHYGIGDVSILSAVLDDDSQTVVLTTAPLNFAFGSAVQLLVSGVQRAGGSQTIQNAAVPILLAHPIRYSQRPKGLAFLWPARHIACLQFTATFANTGGNVAGTSLLSSADGKNWTTVYTFERMPPVGVPSFVDIQLDAQPGKMRFLKMDPPNPALLYTMIAYGKR